MSVQIGSLFFFLQAEDGIRDWSVTGVQTCALLISSRRRHTRLVSDWSSDVCSSDLTAGGDPDASAGHGREPGGHRNYLEHAREDDRDGAADGGVRSSGAAGIVASGGVAHERKSAAACDRASDAAVGAIEQFSVVSRQQLVSKKRTGSSFHSFPNEDTLPWDVCDLMLSGVG